MQGLRPKEKPGEKEKPLTVADLRKLMAESKQDTPPPPKPAIEYRPTYKDPPLNAVSPGNGTYGTRGGVKGDSFVFWLDSHR